MENQRNITVLITGAGSGMGLHTAQTLALLGFNVFAGNQGSSGAKCS